jgi:CBS domain-containing protein
VKWVRDILARKGRDVYWVSPEDTVFEAVARLSQRHVGALLVMDGDQLVGVISERDYARRVILEHRSSESTLVKEIMTSEVFCVPESASIDECMALMTEKHVRHLPVMRDERVVGVLSIGDVVEASIHEKDIMIEQLQKYIMS